MSCITHCLSINSGVTYPPHNKKSTYHANWLIDKLYKPQLIVRGIPIEIRAERALREAVANAITEHKRAGVPITIWHEGKVVQIPPDQIEVHEEQAEYEILPKSDR